MAIGRFVPPVQAGDRVKLASGGAIMTVERVYDLLDEPYARCVWLDSWSRVHRAPFDLACLEITPEKAKEKEKATS